MNAGRPCAFRSLASLVLPTLCAAVTAWAGDLTVDNLTVNRDVAVRGVLQTVKTDVGSLPTNGLIFYYSMNANTVPVPDESGNGRDGTVSGATWTSGGIAGGAYSFDGNDSITCPNLIVTNVFTANLWFKQTVAQGTYPGILDYNNNIGFVAWIEPAGVVCRIGNSQLAHSAVSVGSWYMLTLRFDGGEKSMYLNREKAAYEINSVKPVAGFLSLGQWAGFPWYLTGLLDEVRIYDRALSQSEIDALYNSALAPPASDARFGSGVSYTAPLGDLFMGSFTNR